MRKNILTKRLPFRMASLVPATVPRVLWKWQLFSECEAPAEGIVLFAVLHAGDLIVEPL